MTPEQPHHVLIDAWVYAPNRWMPGGKWVLAQQIEAWTASIEEEGHVLQVCDELERQGYTVQQHWRDVQQHVYNAAVRADQHDPRPLWTG